jgi:tetratricopeptide (TPR) repeat protein
MESFRKARALAADLLHVTGETQLPAWMLFARSYLHEGELHTANRDTLHADLALARGRDAVLVALEQWPETPSLSTVVYSMENRLGDNAASEGRLREGLEWFRTARARLEGGGKRPEHKVAQLGSITAKAREAGALRDLGELAEAAARFEDCLVEVARIEQESPKSLHAAITRILLLGDLGQTLGGANRPNLGKPALAREKLEQAWHEAKALRAADPDNKSLLGPWSSVSLELAAFLAPIEPLAAEAIHEELEPALAASTDSIYGPWLARLALSRATALGASGRWDDALARVDAAEKLARAEVDNAPADVVGQEMLLLAHLVRARLERDRGRGSVSTAAARAGVEVAEVLAAEKSEVGALKHLAAELRSLAEPSPNAPPAR